MLVSEIKLTTFEIDEYVYSMVFCDVILDDGQIIKDVAENVTENGLEWTDSNILHNENRLNEEQKEEVMQILSKWVDSQKEV